jgi:hypothetical protein
VAPALGNERGGFQFSANSAGSFDFAQDFGSRLPLRSRPLAPQLTGPISLVAPALGNERGGFQFSANSAGSFDFAQDFGSRLTICSALIRLNPR